MGNIMGRERELGGRRNRRGKTVYECNVFARTQAFEFSRHEGRSVSRRLTDGWRQREAPRQHLGHNADAIQISPLMFSQMKSQSICVRSAFRCGVVACEQRVHKAHLLWKMANTIISACHRVETTFLSIFGHMITLITVPPPPVQRWRLQECIVYRNVVAFMCKSVSYSPSPGRDSLGREDQRGRHDSAAIWCAVIQLAPRQRRELSPPLWCAVPCFYPSLCPRRYRSLVILFLSKALKDFSFIYLFIYLLLLPPTSLPNINQRLYLQCKKKKNLITGILRSHNTAESLWKSAALISSISFLTLYFLDTLLFGSQATGGGEGSLLHRLIRQKPALEHTAETEADSQTEDITLHTTRWR